MPRDNRRSNDNGDVKLNEGAVKKGGTNPGPSVPRPSQPPKGQGSRQTPTPSHNE